MAGSPKVSIILPVFNRENLVARAVVSVLEQTYQDFEIIVVDDGSTDGTRSVLDSFGAKISVLSQPNRGPYAARNLAIQYACGDYIAFIDSDDVWLPEKLEKEVPVLDHCPDVGLVFGNCLVVDEHSLSVNRLPTTFFEAYPPARGWVFPRLIRYNFIPQSSVLVRRQCFEKTGQFLDFRPAEDYHKWIQISLYYRIDYVSDIVSQYTIHGGNISRDRVKMARSQVELFQHLIETVPDQEAVKLLRRGQLKAELQLAFAELQQGTKHMFRAIIRGTKPANSLFLLGSMSQVMRRKLRLLIRRFKKRHYKDIEKH